MQNLKTVCSGIDFRWQVLSAYNRQFNATNSDTNISERKKFFWISFGIFEIYIKFWKFYEKRWPSQLTYFRNYGLRKTSLGKCLKSRDSEKPSTGNMANGSKHCCSLNDITLTIFINHGEGNCVRKVSFSDTQNLKTVYYDIDFRREVLPA